ncbi:hypothetical protein [Methanosarcina horonobensis]|uniref:hypothetical protein n=1 Tax=Methanosarcina horonobensis TaxID=418008 RepID=UPI0022B90158|nr:hypothetical protein [Methanosarcina horonobensis]
MDSDLYKYRNSDIYRRIYFPGGYRTNNARIGHNIVGIINRNIASESDPITSAAQPITAAPTPPTPIQSPRMSPDAKATFPGRSSCVIVTDVT